MLALERRLGCMGVLGGRSLIEFLDFFLVYLDNSGPVHLAHGSCDGSKVVVGLPATLPRSPHSEA